MNRIPVATPARVAVLALAFSLAGCSTISEWFGGDKVDYRAPQARNKPLDVPPDLTQLSRENRYATQGGVISAAQSPQSTGAAPAVATAGGPAVAPLQVGTLRIERSGTQRWLVVPGATPEQLWPQLKAFLQERGFAISSENAEAGILETEWIEDRTKLPNDVIRNTIGRVFGSAYDTGLRDRYRLRVERTTGGSEVYVSHRGLAEVYTDERKENTTWRGRDSDPQLEAELLSRLMVKLGAKEEVAKTTVAQAAAPGGSAPQAPARARTVAGSAALEVDEAFDRAWRRVGLALDRGGFTVEDRDRAGGLYFVRYADPKNAGKEEPGFWSKLFGGSDAPKGPQRYRIALKAQGEGKTTVTVQTSAGNADVGEPGQRIVTQLVNELR